MRWAVTSDKATFFQDLRHFDFLFAPKEKILSIPNAWCVEGVHNSVSLITVLVNKTGHINLLISHTPSVTSHRSRSAVRQ